MAITEDGKLKAIVSGEDGTHFYVDAKTGELYQQYLDNKQNNKVYAIEGEDLIVKDADDVTS